MAKNSGKKWITFFRQRPLSPDPSATAGLQPSVLHGITFQQGNLQSYPTPTYPHNASPLIINRYINSIWASQINCSRRTSPILPRDCWMRMPISYPTIWVETRTWNAACCWKNSRRTVLPRRVTLIRCRLLPHCDDRNEDHHRGRCPFPAIRHQQIGLCARHRHLRVSRGSVLLQHYASH